MPQGIDRMMSPDRLLGFLHFFREAERLKNVYRTSWTSNGDRESPASHTWRVCLMLVALEQELPPLDMAKLLKMVIVHDLGEAIHGDVPAIHQDATAPKAAQERDDLQTLIAPLPSSVQQEILALWDEYEGAATLEARIAKAFDKIETLMQHNQGANPVDFNYAFNIGYGKRFTDAVPLAAQFRQIIDAETAAHAAQNHPPD
jgi:putative hydrolases of HD superfamily